jgi:hypothetical protein
MRRCTNAPNLESCRLTCANHAALTCSRRLIPADLDLLGPEPAPTARVKQPPAPTASSGVLYHDAVVFLVVGSAPRARTAPERRAAELQEPQAVAAGATLKLPLHIPVAKGSGNPKINTRPLKSSSVIISSRPPKILSLLPNVRQCITFSLFDPTRTKPHEISPVTKILSRILIRQTLPFWQCIQRLARSVYKRTDDAHRRIELYGRRVKPIANNVMHCRPRCRNQMKIQLRR